MGEIWPSAAFQKNEFHVNYTSKLMISKLAHIYYLRHEFKMKKIDPQRPTPTFDGFPYLDLFYESTEHRHKSDILKKIRYNELNYQEMNEVICDLDIKTEPYSVPDKTGIISSFVRALPRLFHERNFYSMPRFQINRQRQLLLLPKMIPFLSLKYG